MTISNIFSKMEFVKQKCQKLKATCLNWMEEFCKNFDEFKWNIDIVTLPKAVPIQ